MKESTGLNRRTFLQRAAVSTLALSALPSLVPASVLGAGKPSELVTVGCIGVGERGTAVMGHFLNQSNCRIMAVCDVNRDLADKAKKTVDTKYQNNDCQAYHDFQEMVARTDIDAIMIASTDHWHVLHALAAVRAGKDVYVEKPLGLSLAEDQALRKAVKKYKRVFQFGTQQRSDRKFRLACELVRNGCIGKLKQINIWAPGSQPGGSTKQVPPPAALDYNFWLGPAAARPYTENLTAFNLAQKTWWYHSEFALGWIAGWGIHPMDVALWGAGDLARGKVEIEGKGHIPTEGACNTATTWDVDFKFSQGLTMKFIGTPNGSPGERFVQQAEWKQRYGQITTHGTAFEGTDGWIHVDRSRIDVKPENLLDQDPEKFKQQLVHSPDHVQNFLQAVKTRQPTVSSIESAVLSDAFCHVADIALRRQCKLTYDVEAEQFKGNREANERLSRQTMRPPWKL